jgi:iron complex transport system permease protein
MGSNGRKSRFGLFMMAAAALVATLFIASLSAGRFPVSLRLVVEILLARAGDEVPREVALARSVLLNIRLPRVIMALVAGAGLGISGAVYQGIFRNPLVSPGVVGVTSGAGFGAALAILFFGWGPMLQVFGFIFGAGALTLTWWIAKKSESASLLVFVLAGVIVNLFFQAMISLIKFTADSEEKLPSIVYWLMGSLSSASWKKVVIAVPVIIFSSAVLLLMRRRINLLSLGSEAVRGLGVDPRKPMALVLVMTTLTVSAVVSVAGIVGWVGLVVPHITRMLVGADHERLVPASALVGAAFFLVIDTLGRTVSPQDLPLDVLTAVVGAPVFIWLLIRSKGRWAL